MGYDAYSYLLVGVTLPELGRVTEEKEEKQLYTEFGEPANRTKTITTIYVTTPDGETREIGKTIGGWNSIEYHCYGLGDDDWRDEWVFSSYPNIDGKPNSIVVGKKLGYTSDTLFASTIKSVIMAMDEAKKELEERFGYTGNVYVISQLQHSY